MKKLFSLLFLVFAFASFSFGQTLANPVNVTATGVRSYNYPGTLLKNVVVTNYYMTSTAFSDLRLQIDIDTVSIGNLSVSTVVYGSLDKVNWVILVGNITGQTSTRSAATGAVAWTITGANTVGTYEPVNYVTTDNGTSTITTTGTHEASSSVLFKNVNYNYIKIVSTAANQNQYALFRYKILFVKYQ